MKKVLRWVLFLCLGLVLLFGGLFLFFKTPQGQGYLSHRVFSFLQKKIKTPIDGKITYGIPDWIGLEDFYVEDQYGDTLVYAKKLNVDLDMLALIDGNVRINAIELHHAYANIYKKEKQQNFNYQFIIDAFASKDATVKTDTSKSSLTFELSAIDLENIRVKYLDAPGNMKAEIALNKASTGFNQLDFDKSIYHLKTINIDGLNAFADIGNIASDTTKTQSTLDLKLGDLDTKNLVWNIKFGDPGVASKGNVASLEFETNTFDLKKQQFYIEDLLMKASSVSYSDLAAKKVPKGMDFGNLLFKNVNLIIPSVSYSPEKTEAAIGKIAAVEQSGFELKNFKADVLYDPKNISIKKFYIQSGNSVLAEEVNLKFASLDELSKNPGQTETDIHLERSRLGLKDVLFFMPDLEKNPYFAKVKNESFTLSGDTKGKVDALQIKDLLITGMDETKVSLSGILKKATDPKNLEFDLDLRELSGKTKTIVSVLPKETVPNSISLPQKFKFSGTLKGKLDAFDTDLDMTSDYGMASLKANLKSITADKGQSYAGNIQLNQMDVGRIIKNDSLGKVSLNLDASGTGFDPKTAVAKIKGSVTEASILGYNYKNLEIDGSLENQKFDSKLRLQDPNANFSWNGNMDFSQEIVLLKGNADLKNLDFKALKLSKEDIQVQGGLDLDIKDLNPKKPVADIKGQNLLITKDKVKYPITRLAINTVNQDTVQRATILSNFADIKISGRFDYDQVSDLVLNEIHKYFELPDYRATMTNQDYTFRMEAVIKYDPVMTAFVPAIQGFSDISMRASLNSRRQRPFLARLQVPSLTYDSTKVTNAELRMAGDGNKLTYNTTIAEVQNSSFRIRKAQLGGEVEDNVANFRFTVKDSLNKDIHGLAGNLRSANKKVRIGFAQSGTILNYIPWEVDSDGFVEYSPQGIYVESIDFKSKEQHLSVNSTSKDLNSPLKILTQNIDLKLMGTAVFQDSTFVSGKLNSDLELRNYMEGKLAFEGDFSVKDLMFTQIMLGNLTANAENKGEDNIDVKAELTGEGNDVYLEGTYALNSKSPFDLALDIKSLSAKTIEAFSFGSITNTQGTVRGSLGLKGSTEKPEVLGSITFDKFKARVSQIGARLGIDKQTLKIENKTITLNNFVVTDSLDQKMTANGLVKIDKLPDFSYDLRIKADKFLIVDAVRADNDYFYGKGYINADLKIRGENTNFSVDGNVKVDERTRLSMLLPDDTGVAGEMENVITFVNMKDKAKLAEKASADKTKKKPTTFSRPISLNVEVDDKSELTIILDELNGDYIRVKGKALLTTGIDKQGELFMVGRYDITEGSYELTYIYLKKTFSILKGSSITFNGKPTDAVLDITAALPFERPLSDYPTELYTELKELKQNIPFNIYLVLGGEMSNLKTPEFKLAIEKSVAENNGLNVQRLKDELGFTILNDRGEAESDGTGYEKNKEEIKKQAIFLMLTKRFSNELSNIGKLDGSSGSFNSEDFARKSLSKVISGQLDQFASNIIKGVDIDLGLQSDFNSLSNERNTNLNLGLSKSFANDRLSVSVGRNFELENSSKKSEEIFDNIMVSYNITRDGRYRFKVFRKNLNQMVIEGSVVETGLGFVVAIDYETWKELMKRKK